MMRDKFAWSPDDVVWEPAPGFDMSDFDESQHPRGDDGKWVDKGGAPEYKERFVDNWTEADTKFGRVLDALFKVHGPDALRWLVKYQKRGYSPDDILAAYEHEGGRTISEWVRHAPAAHLSAFALDDDFEAKHPRDTDGKFTESIGGHLTIAETPMLRATEKDVPRIKALKVPPGWKDIHLSVDPNADLQAVGKNSKGTTVYLYSVEHDERQAAEKFARAKEFGQALPELRAKVLADLQSPDPEIRDAAAIVYLMDKTAFRIGSDKKTGAAKKAYGVSTLEARHVKIDGDKVRVRFVGKSGVINNKTVNDPVLAAALADRLPEKGRIFDVSDKRVRTYMQERTGKPFTPKDFRTYYGTAIALAAVKSMKTPKSAPELKKAVKEVATRVSKFLGNTPAVALADYIDPAVFSPWKVRHES